MHRLDFWRSVVVCAQNDPFGGSSGVTAWLGLLFSSAKGTAGPGDALFALIAGFAGRYASTGTEAGAAERGQPDLSGFEPVRYREAFGNEQFIAHPAM